MVDEMEDNISVVMDKLIEERIDIYIKKLKDALSKKAIANCHVNLNLEGDELSVSFCDIDNNVLFRFYEDYQTAIEISKKKRADK